MNEKVEDIYKKVTQIQHVLLRPDRPDTYVGPIKAVEDSMWILHDNKQSMKKSNTYQVFINFNLSLLVKEKVNDFLDLSFISLLIKI